MERVLVIDDDVGLCELVGEYLQPEGYTVEAIHNGERGIDRALSNEHDLVVLDVMLPGTNGFDVLRRIRARSRIPVLMLTARGDDVDRIVGLEIGADDYLPKPFDLAVLLARINALLRRREWIYRDRNKASQKDGAKVFEFGGKTIDFEALELRSGEQTVHLTLMEAQLLRYLINHEGKIVSRSVILEDVWGLREDTDTRAIDNFIVRLRKYIEQEPSRPRHLLTVRGVGYKFVAAAD